MDVDVDEHVRTGLRERAHGCGETVINHYFYLVMKMQDGCSVSLTRTGDSNYKAKNDQEAIAQEDEAVFESLRMGLFYVHGNV